MKVVICGAGISGLALANQLANRDYDVVVVEKAPGPREQGYMIDFFGHGFDAAEAMGMLPRLRELAYQPDKVAYVDEKTGRPQAELNVARVARAMDGRLMTLMRSDLELALRERLPERVDLRFATRVTDVDDGSDGVRVALSDGETIEADLLVGADGIHSTVRGLVFGEEREYLRFLGFHTAAFVFDAPEIHAQVQDGLWFTDTTHRQMGFYGMRDGRVAAFGVHRTPDPALPGDVPGAINRAYGTLGWVVPKALAQCPPAEEIYYDQVSQIEMPRWSHGRVVLVGDSCYAVSLVAGQGASLGVAGAYVLADQLTRAPSISTGLENYERLWRPIATEKQRVGRRGARWFLPETSLQLRARRIALGLMRLRLPGLDRCVAAAFAGKTGLRIHQLGVATAPVRSE